MPFYVRMGRAEGYSAEGGDGGRLGEPAKERVRAIVRGKFDVQGMKCRLRGGPA